MTTVIITIITMIITIISVSNSKDSKNINLTENTALRIINPTIDLSKWFLQAGLLQTQDSRVSYFRSRRSKAGRFHDCKESVPYPATGSGMQWEAYLSQRNIKEICASLSLPEKFVK